MRDRLTRIGKKIGIGTGALIVGATLCAAPVKVEATAVAKVTGHSSPNNLGLGLIESPAVQGSQPLENPTAEIGFYGYLTDGPHLPAAGDVQSGSHNVEASKTEPDKNTYLVLDHAAGHDASYDYGHHFLFQGHELGAEGYITRVNLDADSKHRVTLFASEDSLGHPLPVFDGSTWDPWAQRLLFSKEDGADGGIWQSTIDFPPTVEPLLGVFGQAGYEGMQNDSDGNVWICEDSSGSAGTVNTHAKQPNSFLFRFVPKNVTDLKAGGKLQVLQVCKLNTTPCVPIVFHAGDADGDILSQNQKDLHTYGNAFNTNWITVHDTDVDGTTPFDANALAKAKGGTPFKRPENGQFRPGTGFTEFYFAPTGDTSASTEAGSTFGGFGAIFKVTQSSPSANTGVLRLFYRGDLAHTAFDNVTFWDANHVIVVEDRGDGLHSSGGVYDSAWRFDPRTDYSKTGNKPFRVIGLGRDTSATIDSGLSGSDGFQNEGDNEITGIHMSNGDPTTGGILGALIPTPFENGWRLFYTQQHGDNNTWEVLPGPNFSE